MLIFAIEMICSGLIRSNLIGHANGFDFANNNNKIILSKKID